MWRTLRIATLLLILAIVAWSNFYDRYSTTDWDETLRVGVFPINAEGDANTAGYIERLTPERVADIERFLNREARRYGIDIERPVRVGLYPPVAEKPPPLAGDAGLLTRMGWSIRMRLYARRMARSTALPPPQIRIFVLLHDPGFMRSVPHSVGLQKGLVGVVHAFADASHTRTNNVVIAHEILHTLGASDKYHPATNAPIFPIGYAEPDRQPLHPQTLTEIMAGRYAVDQNRSEMPSSLDAVRVGPATALEIRWTKAL
jgi:hypothetical protein